VKSLQLSLNLVAEERSAEEFQTEEDSANVDNFSA
jgi:hypothetical protein